MECIKTVVKDQRDITIRDLREKLAGRGATLDTLRQYADGLVKREQEAKARTAELEAAHTSALRDREKAEREAESYLERAMAAEASVKELDQDLKWAHAREREMRMETECPAGTPLAMHVSELMADAARVAKLEAKLERVRDGTCALSGPGRGDCEHSVGLPGRSIPGQHDGPDDTVDHCGKPNGWCQRCWDGRQLSELQSQVAELEADNKRLESATYTNCLRALQHDDGRASGHEAQMMSFARAYDFSSEKLKAAEARVAELGGRVEELKEAHGDEFSHRHDAEARVAKLKAERDVALARADRLEREWLSRGTMVVVRDQAIAEAESEVKILRVLVTEIDKEIPGPANWWGANGTAIRARKLRECAEKAEARTSELVEIENLFEAVGPDLLEAARKTISDAAHLDRSLDVINERSVTIRGLREKVKGLEWQMSESRASIVRLTNDLDQSRALVSDLEAEPDREDYIRRLENQDPSLWPDGLRYVVDIHEPSSQAGGRYSVVFRDRVDGGCLEKFQDIGAAMFKVVARIQEDEAIAADRGEEVESNGRD